MTMQKSPKRNPQPAVKRRRRRSAGVPKALVIALVVIAVFFGGLTGFIAGRSTGKTKLERAEQRVTELENILTMLGFSEGISDPAEFSFDDGSDDEFGEFGGSGDEADHWNEDSLIEGMLESGGEDVVVAEFDGGQLTSAEVIDPYNDRLATAAFGFTDTSDLSGDTLRSVMETLVADKICRMKAEEMGLAELTEADHQTIRANMEADYQEQKRFYYAYADTAGLTPEEADAAVEAYMRDEIGVTLEGMIREETEGYWRVKLFNEMTKDVTAEETEIRESYDAYLADQSVRFEEYPEDYEFAIMSGETITYNLPGYRYVKHILLPFDDPAVAAQAEDLYEQISGLSPEDPQVSQLQSKLDALYVDLDAQAASILAEIGAGADFDEMIAKYGRDEAMNYEPVKSQGYSVSVNSGAQFAQEFVEGSMNLQYIGDVSVPVHTIAGVHIIKYVGEVTPGEVGLEAVREVITAEVLADKKESFYVDQEAQWINAANARYYPERLQ